MSRLLDAIERLERDVTAYRSVGALLFGCFCLVVFLLLVLTVKSANLNTAHVLILVLALVAFLFPWIERFTWSKEGGSIEFQKRDKAIEDLDRKIDFLLQAGPAVTAAQTPKSVESLKHEPTPREAARRKRLKEPYRDMDFEVLVDWDPNAGVFGSASSESAEISASLRAAGSPGWYEVSIVVSARKGKTLPSGDVVFHLHPTFPEPEVSVPIVDNNARLTIGAWGAFTVGAELPNGERLEFDLAKIPGAPKEFLDDR